MSGIGGGVSDDEHLRPKLKIVTVMKTLCAVDEFEQFFFAVFSSIAGVHTSLELVSESFRSVSVHKMELASKKTEGTHTEWDSWAISSTRSL